jgi:TRAP-type C4-dicarboxylate transport system permease small subunit
MHPIDCQRTLTAGQRSVNDKREALTMQLQNPDWHKRLVRSLHMLAAIWLFALAFLILADVLARGLFNSPIQGTAELVSNSIVAIAFLQLSHSIRMRGMLRAEFLDAYLPAWLMRAFSMMGYILGIGLFLALAYASWDPMIQAIEINEYQGDGALRVPTYPVRIIIVLTSLLSAVGYVYLFLEGLRGESEILIPESSDAEGRV